MSLGEIESIAVRNQTTGDEAVASQLHSDGRWDALVMLRPGPNRLEIAARSAEGRVGRVELTVERNAAADPPALSPDYVGRRSRLRSAALERRKRLLEEIEAELVRERERARRRAAEQRKELEVQSEVDSR